MNNKLEKIHNSKSHGKKKKKIIARIADVAIVINSTIDDIAKAISPGKNNPRL